MAVARSPPSTPQLNPPANIIHYSSDPALNNVSNTTDSTDNYFNNNKRLKRNFDNFMELSGHSSELKTLLDQIKNQQDSKFELLNNALATIITQNQDIQRSVETLTLKHDDLVAKMNLLEQENKEYKKRVLTLEHTLEQLDKNAHCSTIEIRNIPKQENENKKVLIDTIQQLGLTLGLETPIHQSEIKDIFRSKSEAVFVDFSTTLRKESLISKYKTYNKCSRENKQPLLNSELIKLPGPPCTLYISEYLTAKARYLFYIARSNVKNKKLLAAWTSYGKVYVKKEEDSTPVRIDEETKLHTLIM